MLKFLPSHADREELESIGLTGLIRALDRYDHHRAETFPAYACLRIRGAILDELRRMDPLPRSGRSKLRKLEACVQRLELELGRTPRDQEIADALELTLGELEQLRHKARRTETVSLDAPAPGAENSNLHETIANPEDKPVYRDLEYREQVEQLLEHIKALPERQQRILAMYYNQGLRLVDIAEAFGVTEARICQIHGQALACLRRKFAR